MPRSMSTYTAGAPPLLRDFLTYISTIRGKSDLTAREYFFDLRLFFRYLKQLRGKAPAQLPFDQMPIDDIDLAFVRDVTLSEVYSFLEYIAHDRARQANSAATEYGLSPAARARKISSIRAFFKYLTEKANLFELNPVAHLESPALRQALPRYLSVEDSMKLLDHVEGAYAARDYCILTLFLNCGLRVSELAGIDLNDIQGNTVRVLGKGNKERMLALSNACTDAIAQYLPQRVTPNARDKNALFISKQRNRINVQTIKWLVKKYLDRAGLDSTKYSAHKLRHTAATLMYQNGVDIRTLQNVLGHTNLDTTMIYTHIDDVNIREAAERNPLANVHRTRKQREPKDEDE